jgi:hypothetical protein
MRVAFDSAALPLREGLGHWKVLETQFARQGPVDGLILRVPSSPQFSLRKLRLVLCCNEIRKLKSQRIRL